jgi:hypothetical protein
VICAICESEHTEGGDDLTTRQSFIRDVALSHDRDECLLWPYGRNSNGYGTFRLAGRMTYAHRHICRVVNGPAPTPKHQAAHSCGNGHLGCCNPHHLSWKTHAQNAADTIEHGRARLRSKLSDEIVRDIRQSSASLMTLAAQYGVSKKTILNVRQRKVWSHV